MRAHILFLLGYLLAGCSSPSATRTAPIPATEAPPPMAALPQAAVLADGLHQISGTLLTPPAGSVVELAVLLVDAKGRPRQLLGSLNLEGTGQALPFTLSASAVPAGNALQAQLRARVSLSGRLVQRLPGRPLGMLQDTRLGMLQLVNAP